MKAQRAELLILIRELKDTNPGALDHPRHAHGDMSSLAPHERLPEVLIVPREYK